MFIFYFFLIYFSLLLCDYLSMRSFQSCRFKVVFYSKGMQRNFNFSIGTKTDSSVSIYNRFYNNYMFGLG